MAEKRIKQIVLPNGDWFRLQFEQVEQKKWVTMTRVCAWAVAQNEGSEAHGGDDYFEGIDSGGYGASEETYIQVMYVHGDDLAPNGKSWRTVFNETEASGMPFSKDVAKSVWIVPPPSVM